MNGAMVWPSEICDTREWQHFAAAVQRAFVRCGDILLAMNEPLEPASVIFEQADIAGAKAGDEGAYQRLIERHQQEIGRFLWKFTHDQMAWDELLQTVFVEAYLSLHKFRGDAAFVDWLRGIATHVGYRFWTQRKRQRDRASPLSTAVDNQLVERTQLQLGLFEMLDLLPPRDRLVLTLLYVDERSVAESARLAGWTESMVKSQAHRARIKLKELWEQAHGK